jgi:cyanophycin synthetase
MEIEDIRVMTGPNMWAHPHKLVVIKVRDKKVTETNFESYCEQIEICLNKEINIIDIPEDDAPLAFVKLVGTIATSLQDCSGKLFSSGIRLGKNVYAVFEYIEKEIGIAAAHKTYGIINEILSQGKCDYKEAKLEFKSLSANFFPGPSTKSIIDAAKKRGIPVRTIADGKFIVLGQGKYQKRISAAICETTSNIAVEIAGNKEITKQILGDSKIPVPKGLCIQNESELMQAVEKIGYPLVVKPRNGNQGRGITTNITSFEVLQKAFVFAQRFSSRIIVEKYVNGNDYRFLVIGYKLIAAAHRIPASVIGDGVSSINQLIAKINTDPRRGEGHENLLTKITIDECTLELLARAGLTLDSVPGINEQIYLKDTANLSTGGTAIDVTDDVHFENKLLAERVAKLIGLNICGIDIIAPVIKTPLTENGGVVLEVNAAPGLRMHIAPSEGRPRNTGDPIINLMFPEGSKARIPIVAVTGTNGKTTTTSLMAYIAMQQGYNVGYTCTNGIFINNTVIEKGDCSGAKSAGIVLNDPGVDFAVLECARGGIIRSGLAFDYCDVAIVTNVASDHLGLNGIETLEDLARVKAVVPNAVHKSGYAVLNAADDLVYAMKNELQCKIALFSLECNTRLTEHCANGGVAAYMDNMRSIIIANGNKIMRVENVMNIPLTMGGKAGFMIENILGVVLAAYVKGFGIKKIARALNRFLPEHVPGRINLFKYNDVHVLIDYVHNPHGFFALGKMLNMMDGFKTGILTAVGDRRDEDIVEIGRVAAKIFNKVIIRIDEDTRGRTGQEITDLIVKGVNETNPQIALHFIPDFNLALRFALDQALPGEYIVLSAENPEKAIACFNELVEQYKRFRISKAG